MISCSATIKKTTTSTYTQQQLHDTQHKKPKYQTVDWAITARRFYLVVDDLEQIEYITLPMKVSEEIVPEPALTEQEQQQLLQQPQLPQVPAPPGFFPV